MSCCGQPLDQFFTPPATAQACWSWLQARDEIKALASPFYLEPAVGAGAFYDLLPPGARMGFELDRQYAARRGVQAADFLQVQELAGVEPLVVVGNPPFGRDGALAVAFVNKAFALGADYVAMILPPAFKPVGGQQPGATCDSFVEVFQIDTRPNNPAKRCGLSRIEECDLFIQSVAMHAQESKLRWAAEMKSNAVLGIKIKRDKARIIEFLHSVCWYDKANVSTNRNRGLNKNIIKQAIIAGGFVDEGAGAGTGKLVTAAPAIERRIVGGRSLAALDVPPEYELPDGKVKAIPNCCFVLYGRGTRVAGPLFEARRPPSCASWAKVFCVNRKAGRGVGVAGAAYFPHMTRPGSKALPLRLYDEVVTNEMVGVLPLRAPERVLGYLRGCSPEQLCRRSTNRNYNVSCASVKAALIAGGFVDEAG